MLPSLRQDLEWWSSAVAGVNGKTFSLKEPEVVIYTDASGSGWGAACESVASRGPWYTSERHLHINVLELKAALYGLQTFTTRSFNISVQLFIDNMAAVFYINRSGGTKSRQMSKVVEEIAAVPGFDMLLFGAGDFSHRIGKLGQATCPEVVAARKRVHAAAIKHGKYVAVASLFGQKDQLIEEGTRIFTLGADVIELGNAFHKMVKDFGGASADASTDSVYANKK